MKVAILGGGFAGISLAWFLARDTFGRVRIDVYDPAPLAMGASRISLGILNPYMGKQAKPGWATKEAVDAVHQLLTVSADALQQPLVSARGVLRPAHTPDQIRDYQEIARQYGDTMWWDHATCKTQIPHLILPEEGGGLHIPTAVTIDVELYLRGLWLALVRHGLRYLKFTVLSKTTLANYDRVVVALGANTLDFGNLRTLPMTRIKGQIIQLQWPSDIPPLPMSISAEKQIVMATDRKSCFIGSTYEREFTNLTADPTFARAEILRPIIPLFPFLEQAPLLSCRARMRGCSHSHLPIIDKLNEKVWVYTGLGSKGLLYHALASSYVAAALLLDDIKQIPNELRINLPSRTT